MTNIIRLTKNEKESMCISLAKHLPKIRELLSLSQKDFGNLCGISTPRLSVIENGHHIMSWTQLTSILFICIVNKRTKEYLYANNVISVRLIQFLQRIDYNIPPELNVTVSNTILTAFMAKTDFSGEAHLLNASNPICIAQNENVEIAGNNIDYDRLIKERNEALKLAKVDTMTGLLNKEALKESITLHTIHDQGYFALLMIDIDDFKAVNDRYGHIVGDENIVAVAGVLQNTFRTSDLIGRFGGDEFVVFIPDMPRDNVMKMVDRLLENVANNVQGITCSVGILYKDTADEDVDHMIYMADCAMYQAKKAGKNRAYFWNEQDQGASKDEKQI